MTTGLTYSQYVNEIATLAVVPTDDPNFVEILPQMITYAENRIYRDLDLLETVTSISSYATAVNGRTVTFPIADFITVQEVNVITPAGTTVPDNGTRTALLPVTKEWMNYNYVSSASAAVPYYFAMFNQNTIILGPWADDTYTIEIVGTFRPDSLSASNTSTFVSLYLPDLMIMASMIYISAFQRNFISAAANDPQMPVNYETQYQTLLKGAMVEEARKKFQSSGWTSMSPSPVATPTRG
jgi:hypothetical protein